MPNIGTRQSHPIYHTNQINVLSTHSMLLSFNIFTMNEKCMAFQDGSKNSDIHLVLL